MKPENELVDELIKLLDLFVDFKFTGTQEQYEGMFQIRNELTKIELRKQQV